MWAGKPVENWVLIVTVALWAKRSCCTTLAERTEAFRREHIGLDEQTPSAPWPWYDYWEELHCPKPMIRSGRQSPPRRLGGDPMVARDPLCPD